MKIFVFLLMLVILVDMFAAEYILPTDNQGNWEPGIDVGVDGGINQYRIGGTSERTNLIDVTEEPYNADNTGIVNTSVAIESALGDASNGDVVYLPAGTYLLTDDIDLLDGMDGVTIRGAGVGETIIDVRSLRGFDGVSGGDFTVEATTCDSGVRTKGTSVLTVGDTSTLEVGELVILSIDDEINDSRISSGEFPRLRWDRDFQALQPIHKITAIGGETSLTIDPPLPVDCSNANISIYSQTSGWVIRLENFGIEDMTITGENSAGVTTQIIRTFLWDNCWIYNVEAIEASGYVVYENLSYKTEIRHCIIGHRLGGGSNGSGILVAQTSSSLYADNIVVDSSPIVEVWTASINNVFAYNIIAEPQGFGALFHRTGATLNIFEGNAMVSIKADGYFGTNSNNTFYRNFIHGTEGGAVILNPIELKRGNYGFANVGNVIGWDGIQSGTIRYGYPNIGNETTNGGTAEWSTGDFWADWGKTGTLTTRTSDTVSTIAVSSVGDLSPTNYGPTDGSGNGPWITWIGGERIKTPVISVLGSSVTFGEGSFDTGDVWPAELTVVEIWGGDSPDFRSVISM